MRDFFKIFSNCEECHFLKPTKYHHKNKKQKFKKFHLHFEGKYGKRKEAEEKAIKILQKLVDKHENIKENLKNTIFNSEKISKKSENTEKL